MERNQSVNYRAYLVRMWREDETEPWRASAESVTTHELHTFKSMQALLAFLTADEPHGKGHVTRDS